MTDRGSSEQGRHMTGGEESGALAVARATLAAEDDGAQAERPEQEQAGALGLLRAAVLRHEAEDPAQVLDVEPAAVRGPAEMDDLRVGGEPDLPAGAAESVEPVGLLAEHEEVLVE